MKALYRSTTGEFYRQHAGFFLVIILLAFGILSGNEHRALAIFLAGDRFGPLYLACIWSLYVLMAAVFWNTLWSSPPYQFVYQTRLTGKFTRLYWLSGLAGGFLLPAIAYGAWIIANALQAGLYSGAIQVVGILLFFWIILVAAANWRLRHQNTGAAVKSKKALSRFPRPVSWVFWTAEWLVREKGLTLLLCKLGSILLTVGTLLYFGTDQYDIRLPAVGLALAVLANIGISYEIWYWDNRIWLWRRSLPVSISTKALQLAGIHFLILIPDFLFAIRYSNGLLNAFELLELFLLQFAILLAYHSFLYRKSTTSVEETLGLVFRSTIVLTLLILYSVPLPVLSGALLIFGVWHYYRFAV